MEEQKERADGYLVQLQDGAKYVQTMREQLEEVCTNVTSYYDILLPLLVVLYIFLQYSYSLNSTF